jgi:hypothetical protein
MHVKLNLGGVGRVPSCLGFLADTLAVGFDE